MKNRTAKPLTARLHMTNITGAGATQLLQSLLPALESDANVLVSEIYLPERGALSSYVSSRPITRVMVIHRWLPNSISRVLECTLFARRYNGDTPILVLGDLPLRCSAPQTVFVQQSNLLRPTVWRWSANSLKYWISRVIFRMNLSFANRFIVQTNVMHDSLIDTYPKLHGKVHVISQPVPTWLLRHNLHRHGRYLPVNEHLNLIYPAANYPHKNHALLSGLSTANASDWPVEQLTLTIDSSLNPSPMVPWIRCTGFLSAQQMVDAYSKVDALLFMSSEESYGFPLVEAMYVGLPIICPNLPYARHMCGNQAIYFDASSLSSLHSAVVELHKRLARGWWPDWSEQLSSISKDWDEVAHAMLSIVENSEQKKVNQES